MTLADGLAALLLPLPPWLGFWIFRRKGRVGLSYGYFLGGILAILALPWPRLTGNQVPTALLGSALFGFTLFLQAQREGTQGLRRLAVGVGGASVFALILLLQLGLPWRSIPRFWGGAILEGLLWLLLADLAHRLTRGRFLEFRMPLIGAGALGLGALGQAVLPPDVPRLPWPAALLGGFMLGLVALEQLRWLREQGAWVEGRAQGLRLALGLLDQAPAPEAPGLAYGLDPRQPQWLVDAKGRVLESNGPFSRLVGLPRHRLRGYGMDALFQGAEAPVWEALHEQLLHRGSGSLRATQVSEDGTFREVRVEATPFDRGMALVWIADPAEGSLSLRADGTHGVDGERLGNPAAGPATLTVLALSAETTAALCPEGPAHAAATRLLAAATRLGPLRGGTGNPATPPDLRALVAHIEHLLPEPGRLATRLEPLPLQADGDLLKRLASMLVLHAAEAASGPVLLRLDPVDLGGRTWGLLQAELQEPGEHFPSHILGLGWLQTAVVEARGMLGLDQGTGGGIAPRIYLPAAPAEHLPAPRLAGRAVWVVEQDALLRAAILDCIRQWEGEAEGFADLPDLLHGSRNRHGADLLLLERTPTLDRFHKALRTLQRDPIPTLVMGAGLALPVDPAQLGTRRLGFLGKPFTGADLAQAILALLHSARQDAPSVR